jgi:hypothetical protein
MKNKPRDLNSRRNFLGQFAALAAVATVSPYAISGGMSFTLNRKQGMQHPDKNGVFIITRGGHTAEEIAAANAEISPVLYTPPSDRWQHLSLTAAALGREHGEFRVVMLGDSIVNDTHRSDWSDLLQTAYPACKVSVTAVVRGSTGCWWYKDEGRVKQYVFPLKPDLLIIGGISHKNDTESIKVVIEQVRSGQSCDVLLMTGAFGETNPYDDAQWSYDIPLTPDNYRRKLFNLAMEMQSGFLDMTAHWGRYIRESHHELDWFKRDVVHANIRGEQVLGHIMANHFAPPLPRV